MADRPVAAALPAVAPILKAFLDRHPSALVAAVGESGLFVEIPPSFPLTTQVVATGRSALDLVQPADRSAVVAAWQEVKDRGTARVPVRLAGAGVEAIMHFGDARSDHGVFVLAVVITGEPAPGGDGSIDIARPAPRLARTRKDHAAVIVAAEASTTEMLGWDAEELIGQRSLEFIHPDDHDRAISVWMECLAEPGWTSRARLRHRHRDGRWVWLEISNQNRLDEPGAGYIDCEMFDISDEMAAHEAVRASEELLRRLAEALPVGVAQFDLDRNLLYANERLYEIVGAPPGADADVLRRALVDPTQLDDGVALVATGRDVDVELHLDRLDGGGNRRCTLSMRALTNGEGEVTGGVLSLADVTDAARMRAELEQRATFDALTGCVNRPTVMERLEVSLTAGAVASGVAVVFIDLDDFKTVNDAFGHAVGDTLLAAVAARIRDVVRGGDVVGRLGGDEFLIVAPAIDDPAEAQELGDRVMQAVAAPLTVGALRLTPSASVGVAWCPDGGAGDADGLIAAADAAMYAAKHAGGGAVVVDPGRAPGGSKAFVPRAPSEDLVVRLRRALAEGELEVHFQPIVALDAEARPIGCEALLRWRTGGDLVPAVEFLSVLDGSGLICEIGPWVIDEVCRQAARCVSADLRWFVNVSPRELAAPRTIAAFAEALDRHGVDPSWVVAEITEHALLADGGAAAHAVGELHRVGIDLALDDFGTGWSSLSTLLSVPVQWLKIDRRFTSAVATGRGATIIDGIVRLADGLGARTIAEGVETAAERSLVQDLGVRYAQGYLFGRPAPFDAATLGVTLRREPARVGGGAPAG